MSISDLMSWMQDMQRAFHDRIALDLNTLHDGGSLAALGTLAIAGFIYGVLHAIGPGHGKVVVSGYMLADNHTLKRGLLITALSSLMQAVVAVALVLILFYGMGLARNQTEYAAAWFECASFGMVALIGAMLFLRGIGAIGGHHHHEHDKHCAHGHTPDASDVKKIHGAGEMAAMVASIGVRPCSGALLLMFFSCLVGEVWAGIAATFAMAIGTAITTGTIAVAAATSRKGLLKLVGTSERRLSVVSSFIKIVGGVLIVLLGTLFFFSSMPSKTSTTIAPYNHPLMGHRG